MLSGNLSYIEQIYIETKRITTNFGGENYKWY